jgi:hypothetical protein
MPDSSYSAGLASSDFYLFSPMKEKSERIEVLRRPAFEMLVRDVKMHQL